MKILFCEDTFNPNIAEEAYSKEYECAINNGFGILLYNFEDKVIKNNKINNEMEAVIYRGWMLNPCEYKILYNNLLAMNYKMINNPTEYQNCHYLPDSLKYIENHTPKTIFEKYTNGDSIKNILKRQRFLMENL